MRLYKDTRTNFSYYKRPEIKQKRISLREWCYPKKRGMVTDNVIQLAVVLLPPVRFAATAITVGIYSYLFAGWFVATPSLVAMQEFLEHARQVAYLNIVLADDISNDIFSNLRFYNTDMLWETLGQLEVRIYAHELIYQRASPMMNELEGMGHPLFDKYDALFVDWRYIGNYMMQTYRAVEGELGISISDSRISFQWYEY